MSRREHVLHSGWLLGCDNLKGTRQGEAFVEFLTMLDEPIRNAIEERMSEPSRR